MPVGSFASSVSVLLFINTYPLANGGGGQFIFHIENLHTEKEREYTREEPIEGGCKNDFFFYN